MKTATISHRGRSDADADAKSGICATDPKLKRPPNPQPFDPAGPEEYQWPRGWFNFGNVVFALSLAVIVLLGVLTLLAR